MILNSDIYLYLYFIMKTIWYDSL